MQIKTKNVTHIFNIRTNLELVAVNQVSTEFFQGEFIAIIGPTGSGKTTFIEHLNGLIKPTSGFVKIDSIVITSSKKKIRNIKVLRKNVGIAFQFAEYQLFEETVEKDIIFGPVTMGTPKSIAKELAKKYIELVGLDQSYLSVSPFSLSGGEKRRVALAGILAMEPKFLILDEPTAGLDPQGELDIYAILEKLNRLGKTIIVVTHNLDHALEYTDRTLIFNKGKLVDDGPTIEVMYDIKNLIENDLEAPKIAALVLKLEKHGLKIGKVKSIDELVEKIKEDN